MKKSINYLVGLGFVGLSILPLSVNAEVVVVTDITVLSAGAVSVVGFQGIGADATGGPFGNGVISCTLS